MNVVFENLEEKLNFVDCTDINRSGIKRFSVSPMLMWMSRMPKHPRYHSSSVDTLKHYIIPTAVNHSPGDWAKDSILKKLNPQYLKDVRAGKAMVAIDQSFEGYQTDWLWDFFHQDCINNQVNPQLLVYVTGNSLAPKQYQQWADSNNKEQRIKVIAYEHFEQDVKTMMEDRTIPMSWKHQIDYKKSNPIKTYNCLNKRLRRHRIWFYTELYKHNLLNDGLVSMNPCPLTPVVIDGKHLDLQLVKEANEVLPLELYGKRNNEFGDNYYIRRILDQVYLDSWVSVVSEPQFGEDELSSFCSEKVFKSIASFHPFIIVGGQGSLARLREIGYKTFEGFIDESYDTLPSHERFNAIIESIKKINAIEDKLSWFESMRDILTHNYKLLTSRTNPPAYVELENYYNRHFNVRHLFYKFW